MGRQGRRACGQMGREELTVDEEGLAGEGPAPPLVGDRLEGLVDAGLGQRVRGGRRLTQRVAGVPHHVGEGTALPCCLKKCVDDGSAPVGAGRDQVAGGDHPRDLGAQGGPVDVVGPADVSGLDGQVELVADIGTSRTAVGGRSVPGPGVGIHGVLLATVGSDAQDLGSSGRCLRAPGRTVADQLGLGRLTVELDRHRLAVEGAPGLDVGAVDRHRRWSRGRLRGWRLGPAGWRTTGHRRRRRRTRGPGTTSRRVARPGDRSRPDPNCRYRDCRAARRSGR